MEQLKKLVTNGGLRYILIGGAIVAGAVGYIDARYGGHQYRPDDAQRDHKAMREYQTLVDQIQTDEIANLERKFQQLHAECISKTTP